MATSHAGDNFASPLNVVFGSAGPQHEKALKQAFYNTAALVFVFLSGTIAVVVYYVLEAFIRPLLWAVLCGTFLHPFQRTAISIVRLWLTSLHKTDTPFVVGFAIIPFKVVNNLSEMFGKLLKRNLKLIFAVAVLFPLSYYLIVFQPFVEIFYIYGRIIKIIGMVLERFQQPLWVWTLVAGYTVIVVFWWTPSSSRVITKFSVPVWALLLIHIASYAGQWKVLIFFILLILIIVGAVEEWKERHARESNLKIEDECTDGISEVEDSTFQHIMFKTFAVLGIRSPSPTISPTEEVPESTQQENIQPIPETSSKIKESLETDGKPTAEEKETTRGPKKSKQRFRSDCKHAKKTRIGKSDPYFIGLFWAFLISRLWFHVWILKIIPILILVYVLKSVFIWFQVSQFLFTRMATIINHCERWTTKRKDAIIPVPLRGIYKLMLKGDKKVIKWTDSSLEKLISVFMILCLIVFATTAAILLAIQVQQESAYMARLVSSTVNETVTTHPELIRWLPENTDVQKALDSMVHRAYVYGREWMVLQLNKLLRGHPTNSSELQKQITRFVDDLYDQWLNRNKAKQLKNSFIVGNSTKSTLSLESLKRWIPSNETFEMNAILAIVKENVDTLKALFESVWSILKSNMNLALSFVTTIISLIFFSSTYVLNTGLSSIVFLTALFYLLSTSGSQYKVVDWVSGVSMGTRFSESVNIAVRDVFGATLKMAAFYGFYTWLTHSIFGLNIVFIPSALAAMLAAIPFIGTYFAVIPGALELWLVQDEEILALLLIILHILPTYVVDVAIYSEITGGGHPYLTGLAVAGGMYWFGLEGAIIGPIVLCCLIAAVNVYNDIFAQNKDEDQMTYSGIRNYDYTLQRTPHYRHVRRAMSEDK